MTADSTSRKGPADDLRTSNRKSRQLLKFAIIAFAIVILLGGFASWYVAGQLIAAKPSDIGPPPADFPAKSIELQSKSGSAVSGWYLRAEDSKGVVVLLHSIRGSRLTMLNRARFLSEAGYSIVMIDLQAHGESTGNQITVGHLEKHDVKAAVEFARQKHPTEKIGVIGVSLGGASALLASPLQVDAMIIESVYPDIRRAVHNRVQGVIGPLATIPAEILLLQLKPRLGISTDELRPTDFVSKAECPILIVSGEEDKHTTATETQGMFNHATEPKELWLIPRAGHVDLHAFAEAEYERRVLAFFNHYLD